MKSIAILISMLLCLSSGVSIAANVGDIIGGYPAGYNPANPGDFADHIGESITPVFVPTTVAQRPATGTMQGPFPAGFSYKPGTSTPDDDFLKELEDEEKVDRENKSISMRRTARVKGNSLDFADNLTVVVTGNDPVNSGSVQYYVGYKLVNITW